MMENYPDSRDTITCPYKLHTTEKDPHSHEHFSYERKKIYADALELIGNTPMVRLNSIPQKEGLKCEFLAKCDFFNPGGSVKDRIGRRMVLEAEKQGKIMKGDALIEPTSGNTGIGLALAAALRGYEMHITLPEKMSNEKVDVLKGLGAKVYRTPTEAAWDSEESHIGVAKKLLTTLKNSHILDQYSNPYNPIAHYDTTGPEIVYQTDGRIDYMVMSAGTGGTVTGVARYLKENVKGVKIVAVDPVGSILALPDSLNTNTNESYKVEGIGYDFIPRVLDRSLCDHWVKTKDQESLVMARRIMREEGLMVGGSCGATLHAAIKFAKQMKLGEEHRVVVLFADSIRNYMTKHLSTEWMVENKFLPLQELDTKSHRLAGYSTLDMYLREAVCSDISITVEDAVRIFEREGGYGGIALLDNESRKIQGVVYEDKLMQALINKNLDGKSFATKGMTKDFVSMNYPMNLPELERLLERNKVVFLEQKDENGVINKLFMATSKDILKFMAKNKL